MFNFKMVTSDVMGRSSGLASGARQLAEQAELMPTGKIGWVRPAVNIQR